MRKMLWLGVLGCFLLLTAQCTKVIEERIYTQLPANVILSGDGAPALNLGKVGDYYLDVTNTNLYGAKTAEGWGTPISLKGLPGNDGAPGAAGSNGTTPHIGDNGNWFIGKKDTGIKAAGTNGSDGTTPHIGDNGNWFIGNKDTKIKAAGANGKDGLPGKDGSVIYAEAGKPTADKGKQGDYYIDTETKMFYGPKGATNWDLSTGFSLTAQQLSS